MERADHYAEFFAAEYLVHFARTAKNGPPRAVTRLGGEQQEFVEVLTFAAELGEDLVVFNLQPPEHPDSGRAALPGRRGTGECRT